jgi:hypothetical protein
MQPRKLKRIRGRATRETVRRGTGSEHLATTLKSTKGKKWILVRIGSNPFDDAETRKLSGHNVEVEGYCVGNEVHYVSAQEIKRPRRTRSAATRASKPLSSRSHRKHPSTSIVTPPGRNPWTPIAFLSQRRTFLQFRALFPFGR